MLPTPPASVSHTQSKPKLGFSIDSLVGRVSSDNGRRSPPSSPGSTPPRGSPSITRSPEPSNGDVWKPPALRFPEPIHPFQPPTSLSQPPLGAFGPGFGVPPGFPLAALFPHTQAIPNPINPVLLGQVSSLGTPLPPSSMSREYPLYPWLLSRHNRLFGHRFPGPDFPTFLLPFRKPKRIRTAFSPSQLLKLEQAFERNQYVVGAERKQLAQSLNLSETQVKVWFQNRRTKHKRVLQDEEPSSGTVSEAETGKPKNEQQSEPDKNRLSSDQPLDVRSGSTINFTSGDFSFQPDKCKTSHNSKDDLTSIEYDEDDLLSDEDQSEFPLQSAPSLPTPGTSFS